jgi:biopolymer transport protein ExbB
MSKPLHEQALELWVSGGWAMVPLAANALILYGKAIDVRLTLSGHLRTLKRWGRQLSSHPQMRNEEKRDYEVACRFLEAHNVQLSAVKTLDDMSACFAEVRSQELPPINRDLRFLKVAIATAPLLGLLGTVTGMLSTFTALSAGTGGDQTMDQIAGGISEALITTQTGLMIALPGTFLYYLLTRARDRFSAFIAHMETLCTRHVHEVGSLEHLKFAPATT